MVEPQSIHKQVKVVFNRPNRPLILNGDNEKLRRSLLNLFSNAVKYTPTAGSVTITLTQQKQTCLLTIADTGYGIPAKDIDLIFSPYHRVEENKQYASGTGLGLSIVKYLIEEHGGTIKVESEVGVGSIFTISLPLLDETTQIENYTIDVASVASSATTDQPDTPASSPHPPQAESPAPKQTRIDVPQTASRS
ncbi:MAG TPA: ATP-binding protein [Anaerolineae bacterium]|nr:ATP-binding protein [Anaerolineae bacterium]